MTFRLPAPRISAHRLRAVGLCDNGLPRLRMPALSMSPFRQSDPRSAEMNAPEIRPGRLPAGSRRDAAGRARRQPALMAGLAVLALALPLSLGAVKVAFAQDYPGAADAAVSDRGGAFDEGSLDDLDFSGDAPASPISGPGGSGGAATPADLWSDPARADGAIGLGGVAGGAAAGAVMQGSAAVGAAAGVATGLAVGAAAAGARAARQPGAGPATRATMAATGDAGVRAVPVVVELFTSQGCANCPPADAMLAMLASRPDVLALAWHVDYWDYLGWTDNFARPEHTLRQEAYAVAARTRGVYTPQFVVDGEETLATLRPAGLMAMISDHAARPPAIEIAAKSAGDTRQIELRPQTAIPGGVTVLMVRYAPRRDVRVAAGENRGETIHYANVVLDSEVLAQWSAEQPLRLTVTPGVLVDDGLPPDTRHAIIAQQALPGVAMALPGPILAAMTLD